jgi:hypothetical protein
VASFAEHVAAITRLEAAANPGAEMAANNMAGVFKPAVQAVLTARSHAFSTQTPSPPGTPPAMISGALAGSMLNEAAVEIAPVTWMAKSGPTVRWSRIQELGGEMTGHPMRWMQPPGVWHHSYHHSLPPRPYLKPTLEAMADGGELTAASAAAFQAAFDAVI